jgi:hypothetical protein
MTCFNTVQAAQEAAFNSVSSPGFRFYDQDYIEEQNILLQTLYKTSNLIHKLVAKMHWPKNQTGWHMPQIPSRILDVIAPKNSVDQRRIFLPAPRIMEQGVGSLIYQIIAFGGATERHVSVPESTTVQNIGNLALEMILDANKDLLNPENKMEFDYKFHCLNGEEKAFALPGGQIIIEETLAQQLVNSMNNEKNRSCTIDFEDGSKVTIKLGNVKIKDVLANLIGHHATHIASGRGIFFFSIYAIARIVQAFLMTISTHFPPLSKPIPLNWNVRHIEYQADVVGAYLAHKAGYNPLAAIYIQNFFIQRALTTPMFSFKWFFSHPSPQDRTRALCAAIHKFAPEIIKQGIQDGDIIYEKGKRIYAEDYHTPGIDAFDDLRSPRSVTLLDI